jgi:hypothetical protein
MSTNRIRSLRFAEFGPPSVLRIEEVAIAEPGEGEVMSQGSWLKGRGKRNGSGTRSAFPRSRIRCAMK